MENNLSKYFKFFFIVLNFAILMANMLYAEPSVSEMSKTTNILSSGSQDVSDRQYYTRLRSLLADARQTIDIGLEGSSVTYEQKDPVEELINDLVNAAKRGIRVRIFFNTSQTAFYQSSLFLREDILNYLYSNEVQIHFINPKYNYRDRLVIVDDRIVLEGGIPWTKKDLEEGLGSATLSYSEVLANQKRNRLELLPLWDIQIKRNEETEGSVPVPLFLLQEVKYFSNMIQHDDDDALKIYLELLKTFYRDQTLEFLTSFEELAQSIPSERKMDSVTASHYVLKTLQRLETEYDLLTIKEQRPAEAVIKLLLPVHIKETVGVPLSFFEENYAKELSGRAIFAYLVILYRLQMSGNTPVWLGSEQNVEQDFPMRRENFRIAVKELRQKNLIEIFPFSLQQNAGIKAPGALEYRYLVNPIPSLSQRLAIWDALRQQYGEHAYLKAREMAEIFGEPEDPKVIAVYLELIDKYQIDDVRSLSQHVSTLAPASTPALLDYLNNLLEHETQRSFQLAVN